MGEVKSAKIGRQRLLKKNEGRERRPRNRLSAAILKVRIFG
jgi:hypothetical protein